MMKEVRITGIVLNNWRGQTREIVFDGKDAVVSGMNHSGKSSVMNAFLWCVTGFDSEDRSNYLLFDNRVEQTHDNAVPAEVEVKLTVDGNETSIKRTATQGWIRRRGKDEYERSGSDNYTFCLDGVERSAGQFAEDMEYIFGAPKDKLKIMLNLAYFLSLDWKMQRKHLGDIIGDVEEKDFADAERFAFIFSDLKRFTIEEIKEKYRALLRPMKEQMQKLPVEIETLEKNLPSLENVENARKVKAECEAEIAKIDRQISDKSAAFKEIVEKRVELMREIGAMEEALVQASRDYSNSVKNDPRIAELRKERDEVAFANRNIAAQKAQDALDIDRCEARLNTLREKSAWHEQERTRLKERQAEIKARQFSDDKCPYCHQELPEDMVERAKEKFYELQDRDNGAVVRQGKDNNAQWEKVKSEIADLERMAAELRNKSYEPKDIEPYDVKLASLEASIPKYEESADYRDRMAQIESKRANMPVVPNADNKELEDARKEWREKADRATEEMAAEGQRKKALETIEEKKGIMRITAQDMALCEGKVNAIAEYERERADIIRQRVNGLFTYCEVQMETTDKSGNTVPACIINDRGGVDFRVTNTASQISCKVDIAEAFQKFYGVSLPLFVDNCEAVNDANMPHRENGQMIELRVSDNDFKTTLK